MDILASMIRENMDDYQRLHLLLISAWRADQLRNAGGSASVNRVSDRSGRGDGYREHDSCKNLSWVPDYCILKRGDYQAAHPLLGKGCRNWLQNLTTTSSWRAAAAGLAIAEGRLGRTSEQLPWSRLGATMHAERRQRWIISGYLRHTSAACGTTALKSGAAEAVAEIQELDSRFPALGPDWIDQAWAADQSGHLPARRERPESTCIRLNCDIGNQLQMLQPERLRWSVRRWIAHYCDRNGALARCTAVKD